MCKVVGPNVYAIYVTWCDRPMNSCKAEESEIQNYFYAEVKGYTWDSSLNQVLQLKFNKLFLYYETTYILQNFMIFHHLFLIFKTWAV